MPKLRRMTRPGDSFDLIVVGLGAMGAATVYQARRLGLRVLGLDRHHPPHNLGSTHAETRITRLAVGEGRHYLPFVRRSHEIWRELEARSGEALLHQGGGLIVTGTSSDKGQRWEDFATATKAIADGAEIDFAMLDPRAASTMVPMLSDLEGKMIGFEPTAGLVMAERALAVQLELARADGADLRTGEAVTAITPEPAAAADSGDAAVEVITDRGRYRASQVVLAAGPWTSDLADPVDAEILTVTRQVVYWFEVDRLDAFSIESFPFVMWIGTSDEEYLGIFPIPPGTTPALKVLGEQFLRTTRPDRVDRTVSNEEIEGFYDRHLAPKLSGVKRKCVKAEVCLYTNTPDDHFLIDTSTRSDRITVMSPCSGHGFKHSAALGEAVAQRVATGASTLDLTPFKRRASG